MLIYGGGGIGKSSRLAEIAAYIYRTLGLHTRVVNADGGGTESAFLPLTHRNLAEVWNIDQWEERSCFATLDLATKGWWPVDVKTPNSALMPPVEVVRPCPTCDKESGAKGLASIPKCVSCGVSYPAGTILPFRRNKINGLEKVGMVAFEGFTRFGDMLLKRLKQQDPSGGNMVSDKGLDAGKEEIFRVTSPGKSHYLMAQNYLGDFVANTRKIPVPVVAWTALEIRADDEGKPLYGPKGPGKALTAECIPWFTDVLHLDGYPERSKDGKVVRDANGVEQLQRRLFLAPHFPPDNPQFRFGAKTSAPNGGGMPESIEPDMSVFFAELEKAYEKAGERLLGEGK